MANYEYEQGSTLDAVRLLNAALDACKREGLSPRMAVLLDRGATGSWGGKPLPVGVRISLVGVRVMGGRIELDDGLTRVHTRTHGKKAKEANDNGRRSGQTKRL